MSRSNSLMSAMLVTFTLSSINLGFVSAEAKPDQTVSGVYSLDATDLEVKGLSVLIRTDNLVKMTLMTTELQPGAYTVWWVVVNPGQDPADFDLGFATSHVVGSSGEAVFSASLKQGDPLTERTPFGSLVDARQSSIRIVVRYHGPVDPMHLAEQLSMFDRDLNNDGDPETGSIQFSDHEPLP